MADNNLKRQYFIDGFLTRFNYAVKEKSMTAYTISKKSGIGYAAIHGWLIGKQTPAYITSISKVCEVLEIKPSWLLYGFLK